MFLVREECNERLGATLLVELAAGQLAAGAKIDQGVRSMAQEIRSLLLAENLGQGPNSFASWPLAKWSSVDVQEREGGKGDSERETKRQEHLEW